MKDKFLLEGAYAQVHQPTLLSECVSVSLSIQDKVIIAKNRDRTYYPRIKIVREIINGLECVYMYDDDTDYSEGMNEAGIGIINTTLQGKTDENEGVHAQDRKGRLQKLNEDGYKIRTALGYTDIHKVARILDLFNRGLGGHTIIGYPSGFISIEKVSFGKPIIDVHSINDVIVRANHGIGYPDQGYQVGRDRESSLSRVFYATKEARKADSPDDLLRRLRLHHVDVPGYLEPYRTNYKVWTSSQIMLNLTDLIFTFVVDENVDFVGIENRLPTNYVPKIHIDVQKLETVFKVRPAISTAPV
jgi:hypothetical protein